MIGRKQRERRRFLKAHRRRLAACRTLEEFDAVAATLRTPAEIELERIRERRRREDAEHA